MKTLVYHNGALGDFLTSLPLLKLFRNICTDYISLLGKPSYALLAKAAGLIDEILDINSKSYIPFFLDEYAPETIELTNRFDRFLLFSSHDSHLVMNVSRFASPNIMVHEPFPANENIHIVNYHLSLFQQYLTPGFDIFPEFNIPPDESDKVKQFLCETREAVVLCPGSGSRLKNWPFKNYLSLSDQLKKRGFEIIWIAGPAEYRLRFPEEDKILFNQSLLSLVYLLKHCSFYIGNDSGITHLAAISGCRTIALFGSSNPVVWCPVGKSVTILYNKQTCSPCHLKKDAPRSCDHKCMESISVQDVLKAAEKLE
ncbi:MAG: glycosyltransferase family 9 protein [Fibrobacter sp.]|jgi:heptosyltransferase-3|nr:glycosyltransferase family 9 protein [Fibrobacter sp.]